MTDWQEQCRAKVESAAQLLDEKRPGWSALIDLDHFFLGNPCQCVLAQVYRERRWWLRWLTFDDGFLRGLADLQLHVDCRNLHGVFACDAFYREHWITAILSRRAAVGTTPHDPVPALRLLAVGIDQ